MLPFWKKTEKFIGGAMPASEDYRTIVSQQQAFIDNNGYNIDYESNWYTPWDDITWLEYQEYYLHGNSSYDYLVNDHLEARLYDNPNQLSQYEINKIKAKLEQFFADPAMTRVVTHNNWGEYGHMHHIGVNKAVRELAVKYRKDVWMLGCNNGDFIDVTVPDGITWTYGDFDTPELYTGIRTVYENNFRWTWSSTYVPSGNHKFIKIVDGGSDKSDILRGEEIFYPGPSQLESGAYIFDGNDDYMTLKGNNNPNFTISMRIRPEQIREMDICAMSEYPLSSKNDRNLFLESNGHVSARIFDGNSRIMTSSAVISADTWTYIAITGNGSSFKLYINGILDKTISTGTATSDFSTPEFILGQATMTDSYFDGQISEVSSYNYAMTDSEIADLSGTFYQITSSSGTGGNINPSGTTNVAAGTNKIFTITPSTGYLISDVQVDNSTQGPISSYTFMNIASDHTISATFSRIKFTISSVAGTGGSITPSGSSVVNYGSNSTYQVVPNTGYLISDVKVD
ncbi:MAG TPA: LamG-like jellyroll fold domain-containing protein, partial [Bacteroidales bacterium]|nr:LamG-like jellyroll fold domain-containing protein [Bacteroidales bacterium]